MESKRPPILDYKAVNDKALLAELILNNPVMQASKILQIYGLAKALEVINIRELRAMLAKQNQKEWLSLCMQYKK